LKEIPPHIRRAGVLKGGYVAVQETAPLSLILLAAGSEVALAIAAAKELGASTRVVSVPSFERFDAQPAEYRDAILPPDCRRRVAIEAGVPDLWRKYVGLDGKVVGISRFGLSAPAPQAFEALGITTKNLVAVARSF
jgi:transketolase